MAWCDMHSTGWLTLRGILPCGAIHWTSFVNTRVTLVVLGHFGAAVPRLWFTVLWESSTFGSDAIFVKTEHSV